MKQYNLENIDALSYIKLIMFSTIGMSIICACLFFILSIFMGENVYASFMGLHATGIAAGLLSFLVIPFLFCIIFFLSSLLLYLGFKLMIHFKKSINMVIKIEK